MRIVKEKSIDRDDWFLTMLLVREFEAEEFSLNFFEEHPEATAQDLLAELTDGLEMEIVDDDEDSENEQ